MFLQQAQLNTGIVRKLKACPEKGKLGSWGPVCTGRWNRLGVTYAFTASIRIDHRLSPAPELTLLIVVAKSVNGHTEGKLGGGCRTLAVGQDSVPGWRLTPVTT